MAQFYYGEPTKIITGKEVVPLSKGFRDISMSFGVHPKTNDVSSVYNDQAIKQSLKNLIMTAPGEKLYNPDFGCRVSQLLFEPLDAFLATQIQLEILNTVSRFDERVRIITVTVTPEYDQYFLFVEIVYVIVGQKLKETLNFILEKPVG